MLAALPVAAIAVQVSAHQAATDSRLALRLPVGARVHHVHRLGNCLTLLAGGARDLPARRQTLWAAIDWSYNLVDASEQTLFNRLAIFVGGATIGAIETVCNAEGDLSVDPLDGITSLLDKSLLGQAEGLQGKPRVSDFISAVAITTLTSSGV